MSIAEVEVFEPRYELAIASCDPVEVRLHLRRERIVHEICEVGLQQRHRGKRGECRHQRRALLVDVVAGLDRLDDRRVRGGSPDSELLETLHERCLRVAGRWLGLVPLGLEFVRRDGVAPGHLRQMGFLIVEGGIGIVGALDIRPQEAGKHDRLARCGEQHLLVGGGRRRQPHLDALPFRILHL